MAFGHFKWFLSLQAPCNINTHSYIFIVLFHFRYTPRRGEGSWKATKFEAGIFSVSEPKSLRRIDSWLLSLITLCTYAQQDYAFGCIGLCVCVYVCVYMWPKKLPVWGLTAWKSPISVTYCSFVEFNCQKMHLLCQVIRSGKEIWKHSINGTREA